MRVGVCLLACLCAGVLLGCLCAAETKDTPNVSICRTIHKWNRKDINTEAGKPPCVCMPNKFMFKARFWHGEKVNDDWYAGLWKGSKLKLRNPRTKWSITQDFKWNALWTTSMNCGGWGYLFYVFPTCITTDVINGTVTKLFTATEMSTLSEEKRDPLFFKGTIDNGKLIPQFVSTSALYTNNTEEIRIDFSLTFVQQPMEIQAILEFYKTKC